MAKESKPIETPPVVVPPESGAPKPAPQKRVAPKKSDGVGAGLIVVGVLSIVLLVFAAGVLLARRGKRKRVAASNGAPREAGPPLVEAEDPGRPDPDMPIGADAFGGAGSGSLPAGL